MAEVASLPVHENVAKMLDFEPNATNGKAESYDVSGLSWPECPVIDFSLLMSPSATVAAEEMSKLSSGLISWNCFQLINHGMSSSFLNQVRDVGVEYFQLPEEERMKLLIRKSDVSLGREGFVHDVALSHTNVPQILNDFLFYTVYPEQSERKSDLWPQNPPALRGIMDELTTKMTKVNEVLWSKMLQSIGFEETGENFEITARVNFSPACPFPELPYASGTHTDESAVTYSLQDAELDGLHIGKDGEWYKLPVMPDAICVKFGDQIETVTDGKFKGTVHRVVTRSEKDRISLALYCALVPNKESSNGDQATLI